MRIFAGLGFAFLALVTFSLTVQAQTEVPPVPAPSHAVPGHTLSGSPRPLAGGSAIDNSTVVQSGTYLDVASYQSWKGLNSAMPRPTATVIRSDEEWSLLWRRTINTPAPFATLPNGKMAIAIFTGPRPTKGYSIGIVSVRSDADDMYITYIENKPYTAPGARTTEEGLSPWTVQLLPTTDGRVRFVRLQSPQ